VLVCASRPAPVRSTEQPAINNPNRTKVLKVFWRRKIDFKKVIIFGEAKSGLSIPLTQFRVNPALPALRNWVHHCPQGKSQLRRIDTQNRASWQLVAVKNPRKSTVSWAQFVLFSGAQSREQQSFPSWLPPLSVP
jgi:hypothetical protein